MSSNTIKTIFFTSYVARMLSEFAQCFDEIISQCSSPPSEIVLDPIGELSTRFNGHFVVFATKSFTLDVIILQLFFLTKDIDMNPNGFIVKI